jgi:hypothetical protein
MDPICQTESSRSVRRRPDERRIRWRRVSGSWGFTPRTDASAGPERYGWRAFNGGDPPLAIEFFNYITATNQKSSGKILVNKMYRAII